jgi:hypothetical protein
MCPPFRGNIAGDIHCVAGWSLHALFPLLVRLVFSGSAIDHEILRPEVRVLLKLPDKDNSRLSHERERALIPDGMKAQNMSSLLS